MIGYAVKNNRRVVFLQERLTVYGLMFIVYGWACYELKVGVEINIPQVLAGIFLLLPTMLSGSAT
jgi:hypothetical protein